MLIAIVLELIKILTPHMDTLQWNKWVKSFTRHEILFIVGGVTLSHPVWSL